MILTGDCVEVMAGMPSESVDAIVCDPPYGLEFMGKGWDKLDGAGFHAPKDEGRTFTNESGHMFDNLKALPRFGPSARMQEWHLRWAAEALRVAKPGAYLLAFGGTRTYHRLAVAIEDAGWIIRDCLVWAYASGFPKSKALLKPAWEPIVMARKPGPLRELAIESCRIPFADDEGTEDREGEPTQMRYTDDGAVDIAAMPGRRIVKSDRAAAAAAAGYASSRARGTNKPSPSIGKESRGPENGYDPFALEGRWPSNVLLTDDLFPGGVSRFFILPKAASSDREPLLRRDRELPFDEFNRNVGNVLAKRRINHHPTVKPIDLMRHLVRLVTPAGGIVLDPFLGSGTTAIAAEMEGFDWIGIEREPEYVAIAEARLMGVQKGLGLTLTEGVG